MSKRKYKTYTLKDIQAHTDTKDIENKCEQSIEDTQEGLTLFNHLKDEHLIGDDNGKGKRTESSE